MSITGSIWKDLQLEFKSGNVLTQLIIVNVGVFVLINLVRVILFLFLQDNGDDIFDNFLSWIMLPADPLKLLMRPWTIITHMFTHYSFLHILFNMLWLYWFGRILRQYLGDTKILPIYLLGGLAGAVLLVVSFNIFPGLTAAAPYVQALGASGGVLAIMVATATLVPDHTIFLLFFGAVRIKYIVMVFVALDLIGIAGANTGGSIAHLGGAALGFVFIKQLQSGNDWSKPMNRFFDFMKDVFSFKSKPKAVYKNEDRARFGGTTGQKSKTAKNTERQGKIDKILDKITVSGYDSLTKEEKEFLFRVSNDDK